MMLLCLIYVVVCISSLFFCITLLCVLTQLCPTLYGPIDCSLPGFSVHGIFQTTILEWDPFPTAGDLPDPGIEPESLTSIALAGGFFTTSTTWEAHHFIIIC